jgi:hypothetical protein
LEFAVSRRQDAQISVRRRPPGLRNPLWALAASLAVISVLLLPSAPLTPAGPLVSSPSRFAPAHVGSSLAPLTGPLTITSFSAFLPSMVEGEVNYLNVTATGGAPPYSYSYYGLPAGCHSANTSSLSCYPAEAEVFVITLVVNDTLNASANASLTLHVGTGYGGPPVIHSFYASPAVASVDTKVLIYANATSKSSTPTFELKYGFLSLPPGCAGFNQTVLQCIPSAPGSFLLYLIVTDGFGAFSIARTWLNVTGGANASSTPVVSKPMIELFGGLGVAFIIVVAAIFLIPRGRKPKPAPSVESWKP